LSNFVGLDRKTFREDAMGTLSSYLPEMVSVIEYHKDDHMDMESPFKGVFEALKDYDTSAGFDKDAVMDFV
jgi:hypothetical protein